MNFTRDEIQDLEDAIYHTAEYFALKQAKGQYAEGELKNMTKYVARLMKLKGRLGEPMLVGGRN